jgi:hypothetical protein
VSGYSIFVGEKMEMEMFKKILEVKAGKKIYMYTCSRGHQFYSSEILSQKEVDEICVECSLNKYLRKVE